MDIFGWLLNFYLPVNELTVCELESHYLINGKTRYFDWTIFIHVPHLWLTLVYPSLRTIFSFIIYPPDPWLCPVGGLLHQGEGRLDALHVLLTLRQGALALRPGKTWKEIYRNDKVV